MKKLKIASPISTKNSDSIELVTMSLKNLNYDVYFFLNLNELFSMNKKDLDIILLEPDMNSWQWMNILIKANQILPDIPVVLFSLEANAENGFLRLSDGAEVFLADDVKLLMENLDRIVKTGGALKKKVLFVDDESNILKSYNRMLRKMPWQIFTALSGEKALELLNKETMDIIITDIKMPNMHGIDLVKNIRKIDTNIPIVVCSGYHGMKEDDNMRFYNIAAFLEKPLEADILENKIKELLN
ncbi:MAG: response regulator [Deltaproteobacteria bacterium]|nr:response regulator [Deltaproteobacteria bacterium]MBT8374283.1 response regulator [Deltaproteobacteria bacterium]